MTDATRRDFVLTAAGLALLGAGAAGTTSSLASDTPATGKAQAFEGTHAPTPLPFDPKSLKGISEKLIVSHWENNYGGAVKALNALRARLAQAAADAGAPPYVYTGLKREQLLRTGSLVLHEYYFANPGGDGKASAAARQAIAASFGTFDAWENEFRKIGAVLGGGSGWVMLGHNRRLGLLENYWMADHATAPADTSPILVMDMYEHAYQMDYGAAVAKYIDAFFINIDWDKVSARLETATAHGRA